MTGQRRLFDHADKQITALDYEIAQEIASTLGRMGRKLEAALRAIEAFDAGKAQDGGAPGAVNDKAGSARQRLITEAGLALWHFIVQREACGLRDARQIMRDYRVPLDVQNRVGVVSPAAAKRRAGI